MTVHSLFEAMPLWLAGDTPEADVAVLSVCTLSRNLADVPFPARCSETERAEVEARMVRTLDSLSLLSSGHYLSLQDLSQREVRLLAERKLITRELAAGAGPRGVYVDDDQTLSIMVNGADHIAVRAMVSGLQPQEAWARLNLLDDTLAGMLDFAFHETHGYLTADFEGLGTGLRVAVLLHLPAGTRVERKRFEAPGDRIEVHGVRAGGRALLPTVRSSAREQTKPGEALSAPETESGLVGPAMAAQMMAEQAHYSDLSGAVAGPVKETLGDLYVVTHRGALGTSEEEQVYRVRKAAERIIREERATREAMMRESHWYLEDRVGRAKGLSAGVHLLTYSEALAILSSMRLGVGMNLVAGHGMQEMNEVLLTSQGAHLEMAKGRSFDMFELSRERAELFRTRFG